MLGAVALTAQPNKTSLQAVPTPKQLTTRFIADYESWNNEAVKISESRGKKGDSLINANYAALLNRYCLPGQTFDGASFGAMSFHSKKHEKVVGEKKGKEAMVVTTVYTEPVALNRSKYEYVFINRDNRWYLNEIFLVDNKGKYATFNFKPRQ